MTQELTEADYKLLIQALDSLLTKDVANGILETMVEHILPKTGPGLEEYRRQRDMRRRDQQIKKEAISEDVKILQGKILMMKREHLELQAFAQAQSILNEKKIRTQNE